MRIKAASNEREETWIDSTAATDVQGEDGKVCGSSP